MRRQGTFGITKEQLEKFLSYGLTNTLIAKRLGCSGTTVTDNMRKYGLSFPKSVPENVRGNSLKSKVKKLNVGESLLWEAGYTHVDCRGHLNRLERALIMKLSMSQITGGFKITRELDS